MSALRIVEASSCTATQGGLGYDTALCGSGKASLAELVTIIAATDRLAQLKDGDHLTRSAVEFVRDALGIERVSIFLVQPTATQVVMRGTWGTNNRGSTTDERSIAHGD